MKYLYSTVLMALIFSCTESVQQDHSEEISPRKKEIETADFQKILDSSHVKGSILVLDFQDNVFYSNDFAWANTSFLPASTFKVPNSIIALETGVVENDNTLFVWDGEKRRLSVWEQDLTFRNAFHFSCVPCYQEIARKIGSDRMNKYLNDFQYGAMVVDSSTIDVFWLEGNSGISQFQQIDFLTKFYTSMLPISEHTENTMKKLMMIESNEVYTISGKTGWSIREGNNNGWFVGYIENENGVYFFATNVVPEKDFDMNMFPVIRKEITEKALKRLGII